VDAGGVHSSAAWEIMFSEAIGAGSLKRKFIWESLQEKGLCVGAMNIPNQEGPASINFGADCLHSPVVPDQIDEEFFVSDIAQQKMAIHRFFLAHDLPDFFSFVVTAIDRAQHLYWNNQQLIVRLYRMVDSMIFEILRHIDGRADVLIVSDHGFNAASLANYPGAGMLRTETKQQIQGDHDREGLLFGIGVDIGSIQGHADVYSEIKRRYDA